MNIAQQIIQVLYLRKKVDFSGLGTLSLVTKHAEVDAENDKILPPKQELSFDINRGIKADNQFTNLSHEMVKNLLEKGEAKIEGLGKWTNIAGKIQFYPEANVLDNSFYGLEAIDVPRIGSTDFSQDEGTQQQDSYRFNRSFLYAVLVALPMIGILYVGFSNSEKLFGKKSFQVERSEKKKVLPVKKDSLQTAKHDSVKTDSLKNQIIPTNK